PENNDCLLASCPLKRGGSRSSRVLGAGSDGRFGFARRNPGGRGLSSPAPGPGNTVEIITSVFRVPSPGLSPTKDPTVGGVVCAIPRYCAAPSQRTSAARIAIYPPSTGDGPATCRPPRTRPRCAAMQPHMVRLFPCLNTHARFAVAFISLPRID